MSDLLALSAGTLIAQRYALEKPLGVHGDGAVYRAVDRHLQRRVTLRIFPSTGWGPGERERFEAGIRKATRLDHGNLAGIRDFGADADLGLSFVVYEPMNGVTLALFLARRQAPPPLAALQIIHDVAEGVGASHWAGLVHGEIHPETVFLAYSEVDRRVRVQLLLPGLPPGFGSAGSTAATPAAAQYAAPEVLRGEEATPASDVYSLGAVAYELLVGLPARWDETVRGALPREALEIPSPGAIRPEISAEIADAVSGAMQVQPDLRFNDGNVFAIVLAYALDTAASTPRMGAIFEGMPEFLREEVPEGEAAGSEDPERAPERRPAPERSVRTRGGRRMPWAAAALVAVVGLAGAGWAFSSRNTSSGASAGSTPARPIVQLAASTPAETGGSSPGEERPDAVEEQPSPAPESARGALADSLVEGSATDGAEEELTIPPLPTPLDAPVAPLATAPLEAVSAAGAPEDLPLPLPGDGRAATPETDQRGSDGGTIYGQVQVDESPALSNASKLQREARRLVLPRAGAARATVSLRFVVLATGRVDSASIEVLDDPDPVLRDAAREVMMLAEFTPGRIAGEPVNVRVRMELHLAGRED